MPWNLGLSLAFKPALSSLNKNMIIDSLEQKGARRAEEGAPTGIPAFEWWRQKYPGVYQPELL